MSIQSIPVGTYTMGAFNEGAQEIDAYDSTTDRLVMINFNATTSRTSCGTPDTLVNIRPQ